MHQGNIIGQTRGIDNFLIQEILRSQNSVKVKRDYASNNYKHKDFFFKRQMLILRDVAVFFENIISIYGKLFAKMTPLITNNLFFPSIRV